MKIICKKEICENLLLNNNQTNLIVSNFNFKKILNDYYNPDHFMFFKSEKKILRTVIKNNKAFFYGGNLPYNDYNLIPSSKDLVDKSISYFLKNNIKFSFTSIYKDPVNFLPNEYKKYDVPYNQNWIFNNVINFSFENILNKTLSKKKRDKLKRAFNKKSEYSFVKIKSDLYNKEFINTILSNKINFFKKRGVVNSWDEHSELYLKINNYFFKNYSCLNKVIYRNKKIVANYNIVFNNNEAFLAFADCFDLKDSNINYLIYLDALEESKKYAIMNNKNKLFLNGGRGSFSYKKKLHFSPEPMFAFVNDDKWKISLNKDLTYEETTNLYKRKFFGLKNE